MQGYAQAMANAPNLFEAIGKGDTASAFASLYNSMEIRTALSPPVIVDTQQALAPGQTQAQPNWFMDFLKPTVILRGNAGQVAIAPNGPADSAGGWRFAAIVLGLVGVGFVLGRWSK